MYRRIALLVFVVLIVGMCLGMCADVPYVFGDGGLQPLDYAQISECDDSDVIEFTDVGGGDGSGAKKSIRVGELKNTFNGRVEPFCRDVRIKALVAAQHSGDRTIDQVCSIYQYLKKGDEKVDGWRYVSDPREDYYQHANLTLEAGKEAGCSGTGDCDDFAILMSSFMESVGGATRIVLAYNKSAGSGHAYTEIYLGQLDDSNGQVEAVINWLKNVYEIDKIYTHINTETKEIWLNLDWGPDKKGSEHPGGPFYHGEEHVIILIRSDLKKAPLKIPPDNLPPSLTGLTPSYPDPQTAGSVVRWTAKASDPNDDTVYYKFWLVGPSTGGDVQDMTGWTTNNKWTWSTSDADVGANEISVWVRDGYHNPPNKCDYCYVIQYYSIIHADHESFSANVLGSSEFPHEIASYTDLIKSAVEPGSEIVHNKAVELAARSPGPYNIGQICFIDEYLRDNWRYIADPRGVDYYGSASNTLLLGKELDCVGAGDCDDYAILMTSLLESIGGTTRIILACNGISCHIFTEVYIGPADDDTTHSIVSWLKNKYKCDEIHGHVDQSNGFWLNLDWNGNHPGGPLYSSERQSIALFRDEYTKTPVNLPPEYRSQA